MTCSVRGRGRGKSKYYIMCKIGINIYKYYSAGKDNRDLPLTG